MSYLHRCISIFSNSRFSYWIRTAMLKINKTPITTNDKSYENTFRKKRLLQNLQKWLNCTVNRWITLVLCSPSLLYLYLEWPMKRKKKNKVIIVWLACEVVMSWNTGAKELTVMVFISKKLSNIIIFSISELLISMDQLHL